YASDALLGGDVELEELGIAARFPDPAHQLLTTVHGAACHSHTRPLRREMLCDRASDASGGTRDQRYLAGHPVAHATPLSRKTSWPSTDERRGEPAHAAGSPRRRSRAREVEDPASVQLDDLVGLLVRHLLQGLGHVLTAVGPVGVGVRVVAFPHDVVDAHLVTAGDALEVVDEAAEHV